MHEKSIGYAHHQLPLLCRNSPGGEQSLRRKQLRRPTFRRQEKCIGGKTKTGLARGRGLEFHREVESVTLGDDPWLRKRERGVPGICRRALLSESGAIPGGLRCCEVEAATPGQT